MPLVRRTRATLRRAEFGFLGVVVYTRVHTPRRCGEPLRAGVATFVVLSCRPLRTSWLMVGNLCLRTFGDVVCAGPVARSALLGCRVRPPHSGVSSAVLSPALPVVAGGATPRRPARGVRPTVAGRPPARQT